MLPTRPRCKGTDTTRPDGVCTCRDPRPDPRTARDAATVAAYVATVAARRGVGGPHDGADRYGVAYA